MKNEILSLSTENGDTTAYAALPEKSNGKALLVIQEWWGVNDHIKDIAGRYAAEGFTAIAPDLYRGEIATNADEASKMMHALATEDGIAAISACVSAVKEKYGFSKLGITGYCMGGTFALLAACEVEGLTAAVPFYGDIPGESVLQKLRIPTLFISGTRDAWINPEKVAALEDAANRFGLPVRSLKYDADHAFFNDTRPEVYNETAAKDAWSNAIAFFNEHL